MACTGRPAESTIAAVPANSNARRLRLHIAALIAPSNKSTWCDALTAQTGPANRISRNFVPSGLWRLSRSYLSKETVAGRLPTATGLTIIGRADEIVSLWLTFEVLKKGLVVRRRRTSCAHYKLRSFPRRPARRLAGCSNCFAQRQTFVIIVTQRLAGKTAARPLSARRPTFDFVDDQIV